MHHSLHIRSVQATVHAAVRNHTLQLCLWVLWTVAVAGTAYVTWHAAVIARHALNIVGLVVHCGTVGSIGLVVLTLVEMRLQPERFSE